MRRRLQFYFASSDLRHCPSSPPPACTPAACQPACVATSRPRARCRARVRPVIFSNSSLHTARSYARAARNTAALACELTHIRIHSHLCARAHLLRTHHHCTLLPGMKLNSPCSVAGTRRRRLNSSSQTIAPWPLLPQRADWAPRSSLQRVRRRLLLTRLRRRKRLNRAKCSEGRER